MVVSAVWLIWHPTEVAGLRGAVVAAAAYVSNWYLIAVKQSYFESVGRPSPLLHLWSLAVEEQFYLIWPLALAGLVRLFRRRMRLVLVATLALAAGSAVLGMALYHPGLDPYRIWYGTDTRAAGILLGAALAIAVPPWRMRATVHRSATILLNVLAVVSLAGVVWMFVRVNEFDPFVYHGGFVLLDLLTVALILSLVHPAATLVSRALSAAPLVWIGRRSYGIYLWHWPIFVRHPTRARTCRSGAGSCSSCASGPRWWRPSCPTGSSRCRCATGRSSAGCRPADRSPRPMPMPRPRPTASRRPRRSRPSPVP